jgi:hypothetical protein
LCGALMMMETRAAQCWRVRGRDVFVHWIDVRASYGGD